MKPIGQASKEAFAILSARLDKVTEEHAAMLGLLRKCDTALYDHTDREGTRHLVDDFLGEYDKRNGTATPPEPPRPVEVATCKSWCGVFGSNDHLHAGWFEDNAWWCSLECKDAGSPRNPARPEGDKPK